jgi:hypothetical protein
MVAFCCVMSKRVSLSGEIDKLQSRHCRELTQQRCVRFSPFCSSLSGAYMLGTKGAWMLNRQFRDIYNHQQIGMLKQAFDQAWPAVEFAFRPGSQEAQSAQECLASKIFEVAAEGKVNVRVIRDEALRRFPPMTAYYARNVRSRADFGKP